MTPKGSSSYGWGIAVFVLILAFAAAITAWLLFFVEGGWKVLLFCFVLDFFFGCMAKIWKYLTNTSDEQKDETTPP